MSSKGHLDFRLATENNDIDDTIDEADFSNDKYADWFDRNRIAVVVAPDVARVFPNAESVNQALGLLIQAAQHSPERGTRVVLDIDVDDDDDIPDEIDFSNAVRGKHAGQFPPGCIFVVLATDVARVFSTTKAVGEALRILIEASKSAIEQATVS